MLKIKNKTAFLNFITPAVKCLFLGLFFILATSFNNVKHPYYVNVIDIKYDIKQKTLQVSARLFTNDLEDALRKTDNKAIDLLNPKVKSEVDSALFHYIKQRLHISINAKAQKISYIGYEKEEESIWTYLEIKNAVPPKTLSIDSKLLYDFLPQQTCIFHVEVKGIKKSSKVNNPDSKAEFSF